MNLDFTDMEYVQLGDAYVTHDVQSVADINHIADGRREIELLQLQGRCADVDYGSDEAD